MKINSEDNDVQITWLLNIMSSEALKIYNTLKIEESHIVEIILKIFEVYFENYYLRIRETLRVMKIEYWKTE